MTRCWPINGKFTPYQKEAYEAVLDVQLDLIKFCRELPPLDALFQRMCRQLGKNLREIGFGKDATKCVERAQVSKNFLLIIFIKFISNVSRFESRWHILSALITYHTIWELTFTIPDEYNAASHCNQG